MAYFLKEIEREDRWPFPIGKPKFEIKEGEIVGLRYVAESEEYEVLLRGATEEDKNAVFYCAAASDIFFDIDDDRKWIEEIFEK